MDKNVKGILYKIQEFSYSILLVRLIALGASIYFILIFNNDPYFNGFMILFFAFIIFIATQKKSITATKFGIETKEFNVLNLFTKREFFRHKDIATIEFTPSTFSITMFLLNRVITSGLDANKLSVLKIIMKDGKEIELKNIGDQLDVENLNKINIENQ
ncbi:hypothetical protein JBL43_19780 [Aureibaculum sp. A20]|uniref:Uncharacterized protein n=1 Tax=Aureibaculum flavum TaxID=2795986 RepID=A0ABS0WWY9_9FLAO|nr:hypothetical protein [Aureibaculum flavum]MBJ2176499.1 hypothetical protein [Aureibaculum flavum]